jgi:hypothetical protein
LNGRLIDTLTVSLDFLIFYAASYKIGISRNKMFCIAATELIKPSISDFDNRKLQMFLNAQLGYDLEVL